MIYERRYIQFNELVFDGFDMISDWDGDVSFKGSSTEYSYGHGSYRPFKRNYLFVSERTVSMTITLKMQKLPCEYREFYIRFVDEQLAKPGKLWCIKNNTLLWAVACVTNISEDYSRRKDTITYDIDFVIPGGIWYKADTHKIFLTPWDICTFMDCLGYRNKEDCDCCENCTDNVYHDDCTCCCDSITEDMMLCHNLNALDAYYTCDVPYKIVYDCELAERYNHDKFLGQRICVEDLCDDAVIAGQFYSDTEIPTEDVTVILHGKMTNPWISINGNINIIEGEFDGTLKIYPNGDVYYTENDDCCEGELLDVGAWVVPSGNDYGWTVNPGKNTVVVYLNECCNGASCIWIQYDSIAI